MDNPNAHIMCAQCHQWLNLATTAYDVIMRFDGNTVHTHHHGCTRVFLMNNPGYVVEEVLHATPTRGQ